MRLEEIERRGEGQREQSQILHEIAEEHQRQVEQFRALHEQLGRISQELTSTDLEQAQQELTRSEELVAKEEERLKEQRRALLKENLELTARVDSALEKAKKSLDKNWLLEGLKSEAKRMGIGLLQESFKLFSDVGLIPEPGGSSGASDRVVEVTKRYVSRLEKAKEQLLQARQLLDVAVDP